MEWETASMEEKNKQSKNQFLKYYKETIKLVRYIAWPLLCLYLVISYKSDIIKILNAFSTKFDQTGPVKKVSLKEGTIEYFETKNAQDSQIQEGKSQIIPNKNISSNNGDKKIIDNNIDKLYKMANNYLLITDKLSNYSDRVNKKAELGREMGVFIVNNSIPIKKLSLINNEGIYVGLIYSIILSPSKTDIDVLDNIYSNVHHQFTMFSILSSIEVLINHKYLVSDKLYIVNNIINYFEKSNPDTSLVIKIEEIKTLIGRKDVNITLPSIGLTMKTNNLTVTNKRDANKSKSNSKDTNPISTNVNLSPEGATGKSSN